MLGTSDLGNMQHLPNEVALSFAMQPQIHLDQTNLSRDTGVAVTGSRFVTKWLGIDGSLILLPCGDIRNYQDGDTETELVIGIKAGVKRPHYGVFGKYRPGWPVLQRR
jgi:hypothetical protein